MTTIAFDGSTMACDSMAVCEFSNNHVIAGVQVEKIVQRERYVFGYSGNIEFKDRLIDWVLEGCDREKFPLRYEKSPESTLIFWDGNELFVTGHSLPVCQRVEGYFAIGSGSPIALGALFAGATASEAVEAAIKHDVYTGGAVKTFELLRDTDQ